MISGLDKGVRILSETNLVLAVALMLFVLAVGPTTMLFRAFVQNIGIYLDNFVLKTFNLYAYEPRSWIYSWTLFYWAWWISWSPFVGMFIARISRGRTVREFVIAVLFVPLGFTFLWMTVFGNTAMFIDTEVANGALAAAVAEDVSVALFRFLEYLPLSSITAVLAVMLVTVFFVTSSDSGSMVVDTIASGGATNTPIPQRVFWCVLEGVVAAVLLLAGGLSALQTVTIASALPFAVVMLLLCWSLFRGMSADLAHRPLGAPVPSTSTGVPGVEAGWKRRLGQILHTPDEKDVRRFLDGTSHRCTPGGGGGVQRPRPSGRRGTRRCDRPASRWCCRPKACGTSSTAFSRPAIRCRPLTAMDAARPDLRHEARTWFSRRQPWL